VTLVEELRRRAADAQERMLKVEDLASAECASWNARAVAYREAADLVEADPVVKAGEQAIALWRETQALRELPMGEAVARGNGINERVLALLATLPKEPPR
jgi:hypothetical protein